MDALQEAKNPEFNEPLRGPPMGDPGPGPMDGPPPPAFDEAALRQREIDVSERERVVSEVEHRLYVNEAPPELTDATVEGQVVAEYSLCAWDAFGHQPNIDTVAERALRSTVICVLVLRNGFPIVGASTFSCPERYNHQDGLKEAKAEAMAKLWFGEEYALRSRLMAVPLPVAEPRGLDREAA